MKIIDEFWEWQFEKRIEGINSMIKGDNSGYEAHLPIMATYGKKKINLAVKGAGLIPKENLLMNYIRESILLIDKCKKEGWEKSVKKRLEFLLDIHSHPENFQKKFMSSIEMYGTNTYTNAKKSKKCTLMFNDYNYKNLISFQIDCDVKLVEFPDLVYRYAVLMHSMFHNLKQDYPCVYKFELKNILDKRP